MCNSTSTLLKICNTSHFWKNKILLDFDLEVNNANITEYKLLIKARQRAIKSLDVVGSASFTTNHEKLKSIIPEYMYKQLIKLDLQTDTGNIELIPEWESLGGRKHAGFIEYDNITIPATTEEIIMIYTKYIY